MNICIWGNELCAWIAAAALAESGHKVSLITHPEQDEQTGIRLFKIENEPGLEPLITQEQASGRLSINSLKMWHDAQCHFIALSPNKYSTAEKITYRLKQTGKENLILINQSNFGIGSSDKLQAILDTNKNQVVAHLPDMLAEGSALANFKHPKTIIIGCNHAKTMINIKDILRPFTQMVQQWLVLSPREAEFTKFANTGMLALRLGYINELANLAEQMNVDIETIRKAMITDPRIGAHYLNPGCGFGGLHFQQYIEGLASLLESSQGASLLNMVLKENENQKEYPFRKLWTYYQCNLKNKVVAIWGVSFKPGTASIDNAPSLRTIKSMLAQGCKIQVHDPMACDNLRNHFGDEASIRYYADPCKALEYADALIVLTEWAEYWSPPYKIMLEQMNTPLIIDGRNMFEPAILKELGFTYFGVGR